MTASFPKFHGITLAQNAWIENAVIENLATDPSPVTLGRVWFNTTSKTFNFSGLNSTGAVVVYSFSTATDLAALASSTATNIAAALATAEAYTDAAKAALLGGIPPDTLETITQLATALQNNPDIVSVIDTNMNAAVAAAVATLKGTVDPALDTLGALEADINAETAARTAADTAEASARAAAVTTEANTRAAAITAEAGTRAAADTTLAGQITTLTTTIAGEIGDMTTLTTPSTSTLVAAINSTEAQVNSVQAELDVTQAGAGLSTAGAFVANGAANYTSTATSLMGADNLLDTALAAEVTRATGAESGIQSELDVTQAGAGLSTAGAYVANGTANYIASATTLAGADTLLDSALKAEAVARAAADAGIQSELDATQAGAGLSTAGVFVANGSATYTSAATSLMGADNLLDAAIAAEVARATGVEGTLASLTTSSKGNLVAAINSAVAADAAALAALVTELNGGRFNYASSSPALTHVVTHGLAADQLLCQVMVQGSDGVYRNDIVAIEETTNNVVTVTLTESHNVKVRVLNMGSLV